jgi:hypothetical protein
MYKPSTQVNDPHTNHSKATLVANTIATMSSSSSTTTPEAIFIPIDLEASLGRIDEGEKENQQSMDCEPTTRTSSRTPFTSEQSFAPYPISETDDEIKERQKLAESVGAHWSLTGQVTVADDQQAMMDVEQSEALMLVPEDDDDFSLSEEEAGSLTEEVFQLDKIQDRVSFWETAAVTESAPHSTDSQQQQQSIIPLSVSFSKHVEGMEW